jgi:hypothetical protein
MACLVLGILAAAIGGCASDAAHPADSAKDQKTNTCAIQAGGQDVLRLTIPAGATCTHTEGKVVLKSDYRHVEIWLVRGARSVDEVVGRLKQELVEEFKGFEPKSTASLSVAGQPARRLLGDGTEADDGDPGHADVVVFTAGGRVFIACAHGETLFPEAQDMMMAALRTAQAP